MPTLQEVKDKLHNVKLPSVKLPAELKIDASFIGNTALFFASPPAYFAKKTFNNKDNKNWYVKSRNAIGSAILAGLFTYVVSDLAEDNYTAFKHVKRDRQEVVYDTGKVVYTQKNDFEVKNNSMLLKMFLPFERPFIKGTYGVKDRWTSFEGKFKRDGLEFRIEGNMPSTTNVTAITKEDLYRYTRHTKVEDTTLAAEYVLGLKEKH